MLNDGSDSATAESPETSCSVSSGSEAGQAPSLLGWCRKLASRPGISQVPLSLLDQAIVSGTSFLTTLMIGRICGAEELGIYSLGFTIIVLLTNLQTAVFSTPYTIYGSRLTGDARHEYAGSVLMHCLMLMTAASLGVALVGVGLSVVRPQQGHLEVIWVMVGTIPLLLLREFVRRFAFAHLNITIVLALDATAAAIQLVGIWLLLQNQVLTTVNVYLVMGLACAIAAGGALAFMKDRISIRLINVLPELRKSWLLGRWLAASRAAALVQVYAVHWILAAAWGASATGIYAACMTLLLAANPFVIGIGNLLEPKTAQAMADGGIPQLRKVVWNVTRLLGSVMGLYCGLLLFAGGWLVSLLYSGNQFQHQGSTVGILALAAFVNAWETGPIHGLRILERPDLSFRASLLSLGITLTLALLLIRPWGTFGGALALLVGDSTAAVVRWTLFSRLSRERVGEVL